MSEPRGWWRGALREGGLYAAGFAIYFVGVQLGAFALASRRLSAEEFGVFALYYSAAVFATSAVSRALQHRLIRGFSGERLPLSARRHSEMFRQWVGTGLALGALLVLGARLLGSFIGLPGAEEGPVFYALLFLYPVTHMAWDLTGTVLRSYRWMRLAGFLHALYALVLILLVWWAESYAEFFSSFLAAAIVSAATGTWWIRSHRMGADPIRDQPGSAQVDRDSLLAYFLFGVATLSARYLDRFIVGAFVGAEAAGEYFAIGVAVSASALPISLLLPVAHGFLAQADGPASVSPVGPRLTRLILGATLCLTPLLSAVVAWGLLAVVYPQVALGSVFIPFLVFSSGRTWYALRSFGSVLITRFGSVTSITAWETTVMVVAVPVISFAASELGIEGALTASGLALVLISLKGLSGFLLLFGRTPASRPPPGPPAAEQ